VQYDRNTSNYAYHKLNIGHRYGNADGTPETTNNKESRKGKVGYHIAYIA
jgi:hypothetical protein